MSITDAGRQLTKQVAAQFAERIKSCVAPLSEAERKRLSRMATRIATADDHDAWCAAAMSASEYTLSITGRSAPDATKAATPRNTEVSGLALKMRICREPCTIEAAIEGVWSLLRRGPLANTAFTDDEHLQRTLRRGLRHIQLPPT
ncbi:hypothetical protein SAMN05446589_9890 [Streptomyces sp. OV198]|nr:hypothetical protein SAMN05446589_9890 [Streptomyces sp. OV198]